MSELDEFMDFLGGSPVEAIKTELTPIGTEQLDCPEAFLDSLVEPAAPLEDRVPTLPITEKDLELFQLLGPDTAELETRLYSNLASKLLSSGPFSVSKLVSTPFLGDGVYALYYHGDLEIYDKARSPGSIYPIYVGKSAQPARTSGKGKGRDRNMYGRLLTEHVQSLKQAGIPLEHFTFRFVLLSDNWVDLSEYALVRILRPVWNTIVHGFGSRCYAKDTRGSAGLASVWDTLHPGRIGAGTKPRDLEVELEYLREEIPNCRRVCNDTLKALGLIFEGKSLG